MCTMLAGTSNQSLRISLEVDNESALPKLLEGRVSFRFGVFISGHGLLCDWVWLRSYHVWDCHVVIVAKLMLINKLLPRYDASDKVTDLHVVRSGRSMSFSWYCAQKLRQYLCVPYNKRVHSFLWSVSYIMDVYNHHHRMMCVSVMPQNQSIFSLYVLLFWLFLLVYLMILFKTIAILGNPLDNHTTEA